PLERRAGTGGTLHPAASRAPAAGDPGARITVEISRNEDGAFVLSRIEGHLGDFLRAIIASADPRDDQAALRRLFPEPVTAPGEEEARAEWKEYVRPELAELFNEAALVV